MRRLILCILLLAFMPFSIGCNGQSGQGEKQTEVLLQTTAGDIRIRLFNETPGHRDNFIKNVREGLYDGVAFHRIIRSFMIQTGDPNTRAGHEAELAAAQADTTSLGKTIPAEIVYPKFFHKRGMIGAAREDDKVNPEKRSNAFQFYIVTGRFQNETQMMAYEMQRRQTAIDELYAKKQMENREMLDALRRARDLDKLSDECSKLMDAARFEVSQNPPAPFTEEQMREYRISGGAPWLDGNYTIFGEVVEGMKTVLTIERTKTDEGDRPLKEVRILAASLVD